MVSRNIDIPMEKIAEFCHKWKIRQFSLFGSVLREDFGPDSDVVERKLEIIGEAARKVSVEFQRRNPGIPWRGVISQRHFLAHEYGDVRQEKLWRVATLRIPELIAMLAPLLPPDTD